MSTAILTEAAAKFTRFKQFIADRAPPSVLVQVFLSMGIVQMLDILRPNKDKPIDNLLTEILVYAGLSQDQFALEDVITARLYLEYFTWVLNQEAN